MKTENDLLNVAIKAASQVRRERPSLWSRFVAWYNEAQCQQGRHAVTGWTYRREISIYAPGTSSENSLPIERIRIWDGKCRYCGAPHSRRVPE